MKPYYRHVSKNAARNPVARAVASNALAKAVTDQKIALYMLQSGDKCASILAGVSTVLQVVQAACQLEHVESVDTRVLKGGLNACLQVVLADSYDPLQTVAINNALEIALRLAKTLKPESINTAWQGVHK
jgi:hypothetical protein